MNFVEKYRAKNFESIKGQDEAIYRIKSFINYFPKKKAVILYGPAGSGKTSIAYALANELKAEIIELNASDFRSKDIINAIVGEASQQKSIFAKNKVILIDEIDGVSGFYDKGGLSEITRLIENTNFPVVMTANDIWDKRFSLLRKEALMINVRELDYRVILGILKDIATKENLNLSGDFLKAIAINAQGDVRAALNDLQSVCDESKLLPQRDREENIFDVLNRIFKDMPSNEIIELYDKLNMPIEEISLWLEENIPREYKGSDLAKAINALSKADVFKGRIYRQQHWRFLIYQNFFLSYGVSASKNRIKRDFTSYKRPDRILKIWLINQKNLRKKEIAKKYARYCHISFKRAMSEFPIYKTFLKNPEIQKKLKLTDDEIEYLGRRMIKD